MNFYDNKFFQWLEVVTNFFLLNILWFVSCLPIITIFPATAAMFGVVRKWKLEQGSGVFSLFIKMFKENFKQSFIIGIIWAIVVFILIVDFRFINNIDSTINLFLYPIFMLISLLLVFITIYLFSVMVHFDTTIFGVIKNSLILSLSNLFGTILAIIIIVACYFLTIIVPPSMFVVFSASAYIIYSICNKSFEKVARLQKEAEEEN